MPEEQAAAQAAATSTGVKQLVQRMELEHIADRSCRSRQQQYARARGGALLRARREGPLGPSHRPRRRRRCRRTTRRSSCVPDISEEIHRIDQDPELSPHERIERAPRGRGASTRSRARSSTSSTSCCRRTSLYEKDVDYVVQEGQVLIVDEFTGRMMPGRRWSDGLHQAVEAKEGVQVKGETQTLRHHHDPELLPHVRQAGRHDRHRRDRGDGVLPDLRARGRRSSRRNRPIVPRRPARPGLQDPAREVQRDRRRDRAAARARLSGPDRHGERRRVGDAVAHAQARAGSSTTC